MKISWLKDDDFFESSDGRFEIVPNYCGLTRPAHYTVRDTEAGKVETAYTIKDAKALCAAWAK